LTQVCLILSSAFRKTNSHREERQDILVKLAEHILSTVSTDIDENREDAEEIWDLLGEDAIRRLYNSFNSSLVFVNDKYVEEDVIGKLNRNKN